MPKIGLITLAGSRYGASRAFQAPYPYERTSSDYIGQCLVEGLKVEYIKTGKLKMKIS